jgi:aminopeptidase N
VEAYFSKQSGKDLSKIFDQYLRTIKIPVLEYKIKEQEGQPGWYQIEYKWSNCVEGFKMPVRIYINGNGTFINPRTTFERMVVNLNAAEKKLTDISVDQNFYITAKKVE